ncbi:uncharacterized protein [Scyliorhinus torazame]|uniref:uncharacterized protein n=1 Tax=Scyliorhinus torazame TaxID=75743 RepID=UPI003B5BF075
MAFTLPWRIPNMATHGHPCSKASGDCCQYVGQVIVIILGTVVALQITINTIWMVRATIQDLTWKAVPRLRRLMGFCWNFRIHRRSSKRLLKSLENAKQISHSYLLQSVEGHDVADGAEVLKGREEDCEDLDGSEELPGNETPPHQHSYPCCQRYRCLDDSSESRSSAACGHGGSLSEACSRPCSPERWTRLARGSQSPALSVRCQHPAFYRVSACQPATPSPKSSSGGRASPRCHHVTPEPFASRSVSCTPDSPLGSEGPAHCCLTPDPCRSSASADRSLPRSPGPYPGGSGGRASRSPDRSGGRSPDPCASCAPRCRLPTGDFPRRPAPRSPDSCASRASCRGRGGPAPGPEPPASARGRPPDRCPPPAGAPRSPRLLRRTWYPPAPPCSSSASTVILLPSATHRGQLRAWGEPHPVNERQRTGRVVYDARLHRIENARGDGGGNGRGGGNGEPVDPAAHRACAHKDRRGNEGANRVGNPICYTYLE